MVDEGAGGDRTRVLVLLLQVVSWYTAESIFQHTHDQYRGWRINAYSDRTAEQVIADTLTECRQETERSRVIVGDVPATKLRIKDSCVISVTPGQQFMESDMTLFVLLSGVHTLAIECVATQNTCDYPDFDQFIAGLRLSS